MITTAGSGGQEPDQGVKGWRGWGAAPPGAVIPLVLLILLPALAAPLTAHARALHFTVDPNKIPCGEYSDIQPIVWYGNDDHMTIAELAAYCAPVLWFSPDEPLLRGAHGRAIMIPEPFPFEDPSSTPVVYYRVRSLLRRGGETETAYAPDSTLRANSVIDLDAVVGIDLDYFFYYSSEAGLGVHQHDVESAQFQVAVWKRDRCPDARYHLVVTTVTGKAHGLAWYDNTLGVDEYARFPIHLLVEEGKHATCTDKNGDGYYTPNYDVNRHVNDAWAVRDVIRSGSLFTGSYQAWMSKVRHHRDRVLPPLPEDSPLREAFTGGEEQERDNAVYSLRPFPSAERASPELVHFIADKGDPNWPEVVKNTGVEHFQRWVGSEPFVKSLSIAFYMDGDVGVSFVFPLFVVANFEEPMTGGFVTNRVVLKDQDLRDFAWMLHYTPSASRWLDTYLSAGAERDSEPGEGSDTFFVLETGLKMRASLQHSPFAFMTKVTDFWGVRLGIKNYGAFEIHRLRYVFEVGAGTW